MSPWLLLAPVEARATLVQVTFCGSYGVGFVDIHEEDPGVPNDEIFANLDDDYFRDNLDKAARGAEVRIKNLTALDEYTIHLPWNGGAYDTEACLGTFLTEGTSYSIKLHSAAEIDGNTIAVHPPEGGR